VAPLPDHVDITALQQVVEYVLKFVDLTAPPTGVYVMRQLASIVSQTRLSPSVSLTLYVLFLYMNTFISGKTRDSQYI